MRRGVNGCVLAWESEASEVFDVLFTKADTLEAYQELTGPASRLGAKVGCIWPCQQSSLLTYTKTMG